jgi:hypothetical protein
MALDSVGARIEGDVFQGLFFWREAAGLLLPETPVARVELEHDEADGVDDVAVFYDAPGKEAGGFRSLADFYQMKYHVDRRDDYSADAIIDPEFVGKKQSLLQRFHGAYNKVRSSHATFRLHLASNWRWSADVLGKHLREYDGALPDEFFTAGPRSAVGKIREAWRSHLGLDKDAFAEFARHLRFQTDMFGRRFYREFVNDRLARAGLKPVPDDRAASPYESLTQKFLMDRKASFDRTTFRDLCAKEDLLAGAVDDRRSRTIGVRSFLRFAETLEEEAAVVVSVVDQFSGRHPKDDKSWATATSSLQKELAVPDRQRDLRAHEHAVMLECHGSLALAAGYELSNNSGALAYPVQKPGHELWKPTGKYNGDLWKRIDPQPDRAGKDVVVTLSVTHDVRADVNSYVSTSKLEVGRRIDLQPAAGFGPQSIVGADHAAALAGALVEELRKARIERASIVHLFAAAPNGLMFFIGQQREALARIQIYEFDFSFERDGSYAASISIPHKATTEE